MKILITGANGLLGQKLVEMLGQKPDWTVLATGRGECRIARLPANVSYSSCDISSEESVNQIFKEFGPTTVLHTAAMTNVDECELNPEACRIQNVDAVKNVIAACEKTGAHLIHLSTDFIFGGEGGPYDETAKPNPISI
jgi:dTDP-4-dehydrorhamnose reductase